jgi:hypothetical protein
MHSFTASCNLPPGVVNSFWYSTKTKAVSEGCKDKVLLAVADDDMDKADLTIVDDEDKGANAITVDGSKIKNNARNGVHPEVTILFYGNRDRHSRPHSILSLHGV